MSNNAPDYKDNLFFEPDYSIYQTARKIKKLAKERNIKIYRDCYCYLNFLGVSIDLSELLIDCGNIETGIKIKSNKHLVDIVEVLTRS